MGRFRDTENKDYRMQFLFLVSILLTLIANSSSMDVRNLTKGSYATINCTYGEGEVRNLFWYHGNCSEAASIIVRYFKGSVISSESDETRFDLEDDNSTLILKNVSIEDEGTYCCSVDIKGGTLNPNTFLTRVNVFGSNAKTLPVVRQCQEDAHDDLISTTCTLNAPTNLTCVLHGVYPNRNVKLAWQDDEGTISSISESYSNDDMTYTFLATIHVSEEGSFWCNASFPSEAGLAETGVSVTVLDPVHRSNNVAVIVPIVCIFTFVFFIVMIVWYCRRKQNTRSDAGLRDAQGRGDERREQTEEDQQSLCLLQTVAETEGTTPHESDGLVPDAQRRGNDRPTEQTEEDPQSSLPVQMDNGEGSSTSNESDGLVPDAQRRGNEPTEQSKEDPQSSLPVQMDNGEGSSTSNETHQEIPHNLDKIRDEVPDEKLDTLAIQIPNEKYTDLANRLGISFTPAGNILAKHVQDYMKAIRECLAMWKNRTGGSKAELKEILCRAEIGGLVKYIEQ